MKRSYEEAEEQILLNVRRRLMNERQTPMLHGGGSASRADWVREKQKRERACFEDPDEFSGSKRRMPPEATEGSGSGDPNLCAKCGDPKSSALDADVIEDIRQHVRAEVWEENWEIFRMQSFDHVVDIVRDAMRAGGIA
jgi:hypothetical protein